MKQSASNERARSQRDTQANAGAARFGTSFDEIGPASLLDTADSGLPALPDLDPRVLFEREALALAEQRPERAAQMWIETAVVSHEAGESDDEVLRGIDAALQLRPNTGWVLMRARALLLERRLYQQTLRLAERAAQAGGDSSERAALLFEASSVQLYCQRDGAEALRLAEQVLRIQPHHLASLVRVATLRERFEQYAEAARAWQQLSEYLSDPTQRAQSLYATATIHEMRLGQDEPAQACYLRAVESDPQFLPALVALSELRERHEQWGALCQSLEQLAAVVDDMRVKARLWRQAGTLHLDRTGNLEAACRQLQLAVEASPQEVAVLQRLAQAWQARGRAPEVVATLRQLLELTLDRQSRAALLTHLASVQLEHLNDADGAIAAFREALVEVPSYLPALQSLGLLYRQRGDFVDLVEISNPEMEGMLPPETRAMRYIDLAEILRQRLAQPAGAIAAYRRALELSPGNLMAFWPMSRLLHEGQHFGELSELLRVQAAASEDHCTRAHLLLARARLLAGPLADPEAAIETLRGARPDDGARSVALEQIALHEQAGRHAVLVELLQVQAAATEDRREAEGRRLHAASVLELELDETDKALELYREVLAENPQCATAVHGAGRILHRRAAWAELVKLHQFELEHHQRIDAPTLLCRVGRILAEKLGQLDAAVQSYATALQRDPTCTPALAALQQLASGREQWGQLVAVLERRARERGDTSDAMVSLCRAAEVAGWQLGCWQEAQRLYELALEQSPRLEAAQHGLLRVLLHDQCWADAADLLTQMIERAGPAQPLLELLLVRTLMRRLDAAGWFEQLQRCGELLADQLQLELTRARRVRQAHDLAPWLASAGHKMRDEALGAAYLLEAAHVWELSETADAARAAEASRAAHQRLTVDLGSIWALERALAAQRRWSELGQLRQKEAQLEVDRDMRSQRLIGAARACLLAGERSEATRLCREGLSFDPHQLPALLMLAKIAEEERDWRCAAELYDQIAGICAAAENRRAHALRAALIWAGVVRERARALASVAVALSDDPSHEESFAFAERLLRAQDDLEELSSIYQRATRACADEGRRIELLRQHARLLAQIAERGGGGALDRAIAELNALLALAPRDVDALAELAELQSRQKRWSDAALTLGRLIEQAQEPAVGHTARVQQAEIWLDRLHEPERAREVLVVAARERPDDLGVTRLQLRVMRAVGDWDGARMLLERLGRSDLLAVSLWAKLQLGEIAGLGLNDAALQLRCEQDVVDLAAAEESVAGQLGELQPDVAQLRRLAELAQRGLESQPDAIARGRRRFIAAIAVDYLREPERALQHLQLLLADRADDPYALMLMGRALEAKDEPSAAVDYYRKVLEVDASAVEAYRGLVRTAGEEVALSAAAIVDLFGAADEQEESLLAGIDWDELPNGSLCAEPPQPEERFNALRRILEALLPYLNAAYPALPGEVVAADHPLVEPVQHLAHTIGLGAIEIKVGETGAARVGIGRPTILQAGSALAEQPWGPGFRFWIGRALARALVGGAIVQQLDEDEFEQLFRALRERRTAASTARELQKTLHRVVPRKVRRQVLQLLPKARDPKLWARYRRRLERWADRLALVLCRQPAVGLRALARSEGLEPADAPGHDELAALLRFVVSEEFARLYRGVWRPRPASVGSR